eukprot:6187025-Pyramimonas_sp.AAC.1
MSRPLSEASTTEGSRIKRARPAGYYNNGGGGPDLCVRWVGTWQRPVLANVREEFHNELKN